MPARRLLTPFRVLAAWMIVAVAGLYGMLGSAIYFYPFVRVREWLPFMLHVAAFGGAAAALALGAIMVRVKWAEAMIDPQDPSQAQFIIPSSRADRLLVTRCFLPH